MKRVLFSILFFANAALGGQPESKPLFGGQSGNGGFLFYGNVDKLFEKAKTELVAGLESAPASIFKELQKPVDRKEFIELIRNVVPRPGRFDSRSNPNDVDDTLTADYGNSEGKKYIEILAPLLIIVAAQSEPTAIVTLQKALLLEALHHFEYDQIEAQIGANHLYGSVFYSSCTKAEMKVAPTGFNCVTPYSPVFKRTMQQLMKWMQDGTTVGLEVMLDTRSDLNEPDRFELFLDLSNASGEATLTNINSGSSHQMKFKKFDSNILEGTFKLAENAIYPYKAAVRYEQTQSYRTLYVTWSDSVIGGRDHLSYGNSGPIYIRLK